MTPQLTNGIREVPLVSQLWGYLVIPGVVAFAGYGLWLAFAASLLWGVLVLLIGIPLFPLLFAAAIGQLAGDWSLPSALWPFLAAGGWTLIAGGILVVLEHRLTKDQR